MTARIFSLPLHVANQIAAGEVIESPASVVKELLENALDAKSTRVIIDIGFGGLNHIIVSDNGVGIHPEDLPLVVAPHATSKLKTLEDLYALNTMGFRGEALASIASVARVIVTSKSQDSSEAAALHAEEGRVKIFPAAREQGTTVEVRDLFHRIPVRKTFLKSEAVEYLNIETVVKRFALAEMAMTLKLIHNGQVKLDLPAATADGSRQVRLKRLLGKTFFEHAFSVEALASGLRLTGWVADPTCARSQSDRQWIYLNQRMVKDKLLTHAVKMAYEGKVHPGKYPIYVLYFTISPSEVDVNVHPTKHEVRFTQPRLVHDFIYSAVARVLSESVYTRPHEQSRLDERKANTLSIHRSSHQSGGFSEEMNWLTLNKAYAVLEFERMYFLVNIVRLRYHAQMEMCPTLPVPWISRPLLVPVVIPLPHAALLFENFHAQLHDFGFELVLEFHDHLRVNAIPAVTPLLDLHCFFQRLPKTGAADTHALLSCLFSAEAWDLKTMSSDEKIQWWDFWYAGMQKNRSMPYTVCLDETHCGVLERD